MDGESTLNEVDLLKVDDIKEILTKCLGRAEFELYPFKIGWYNSKVTKPFKLLYQEDTLAFVAISKPSMFENTFLPFLRNEFSSSTERIDLLDECMRRTFNSINTVFSADSVEIIHDFELTPMRRPKILLQTAGHVSGAVRYYQKQDVENKPWNEEKGIYGVCIHPDYGGWFSLRAIIIFKKIICPALIHRELRDILPDEATVIRLLNLFNDHWQDGRYRDIIPVKQRYSQLQIAYFAKKPCERVSWIRAMLEDMKADSVV